MGRALSFIGIEEEDMDWAETNLANESNGEILCSLSDDISSEINEFAEEKNKGVSSITLVLLIPQQGRLRPGVGGGERDSVDEKTKDLEGDWMGCMFLENE